MNKQDINKIICIECYTDKNLTTCNFCGIDVCFDCLTEHEANCPDNYLI